MEDKKLYEMYHNVQTTTQAQEIAIIGAETVIKQMLYHFGVHNLADKDDIAQEARLAVVQALSTYDYTKCSWMTWQTKYVKNAVYHGAYKAKCGGVSKYMQDKYNISRDVSIYEQKHGEKEMDNDGYGINLTYEDIMDNPLDVIIKQQEQNKTKQKVMAMLAQLSPKQQYVITHSFGLHGGNPMSDKELSIKLGINVKDVQRCKYDAINRLKRMNGVQKTKKAYDKTGERIKDVKGRTVVIVRYKNCKDMDAIMHDGNNYFIIYNTTYAKLSQRDVLYQYNGCNVAHKISAETVISGKCACAYF